MIARMTTPLTETQARQAEAAVLGRAGWLTLGQLHAALRRAIIKADPDGAEQRRQKTERGASVVFYPEDEGTATLAGYNLPGVQAPAPMARPPARARPLNPPGSAPQTALLRVHVFLGLPPGPPPPPDTPAAPAPPDDPTGGQPPAGGAGPGPG